MQVVKENSDDCSSGPSEEGCMGAAAKSVEALDQQGIDLGANRRRKSRKRNFYDEQTKTAIGKYATINGNKSAVEKFSKSLGFPVSEILSVRFCSS